MMKSNKRPLVDATSLEVTRLVIPVQAGIYNQKKLMDSRLRGNDNNGPISTFLDFIILQYSNKDRFLTGFDVSILFFGIYLELDHCDL
jgi:hypothetical protein